MGVLIDGRWEKDRFDTRKVGGKFVRADSPRWCVSMRCITATSSATCAA